jgi:hypothetical protein
MPLPAIAAVVGRVALGSAVRGLVSGSSGDAPAAPVADPNSYMSRTGEFETGRSA